MPQISEFRSFKNREGYTPLRELVDPQTPANAAAACFTWQALAVLMQPEEACLMGDVETGTEYVREGFELLKIQAQAWRFN